MRMRAVDYSGSIFYMLSYMIERRDFVLLAMHRIRSTYAAVVAVVDALVVANLNDKSRIVYSNIICFIFVFFPFLIKFNDG